MNEPSSTRSGSAEKVVKPGRYQAVVIGGSAGATAALTELLPVFPITYPMPIVVVQHLHPLQEGYFAERFAERCALTIKEADDKEAIRAGYVYFAPPNYHLLIEADLTFSLSIDEKVNYARPSIDVLFESAADAYGSGLIGVILTGANEDGARGLRTIKERGGLAVVQNPATAESSYMPRAALAATAVDYVLALPELARLLAALPGKN